MHDNVIAAYVCAMDRHPKLKLMLLTHVNHRNGMVLPVADNFALLKKLVQEHGIFAVSRDGLANGACVRVTPAIFTPESHLDKLVEVLRKVAKG